MGIQALKPSKFRFCPVGVDTDDSCSAIYQEQFVYSGIHGGSHAEGQIFTRCIYIIQICDGVQNQKVPAPQLQALTGFASSG